MNILVRQDATIVAHSLMSLQPPSSPNIESFFDYAIRMLHIDDEIEYYEALHSEANRLYNENPDACNLNPPVELKAIE